MSLDTLFSIPEKNFRPPSPSTLALAVVGSFLTWYCMYSLLQVANPCRLPEWNCRVITFLHACLSSSLSIMTTFITGPCPFTYLGRPCSSNHTAILLLSLGYFLFDLLWCVYMQTEGVVMLAHHLVSIYGLLYALSSGQYCSELVTTLGCSEITNPLLQTRWFMKQHNSYTGRRALCIDCAFVFLFLCVRLGLGSVFLVIVLRSSDIEHIVPKAGALAFYVISLVFSLHLVHYIRLKYFASQCSHAHS